MSIFIDDTGRFKIPLELVKEGLRFSATVSSYLSRGKPWLKDIFPEAPNHHIEYLMTKVASYSSPMNDTPCGALWLSNLAFPKDDQMVVFNFIMDGKYSCFHPAVLVVQWLARHMKSSMGLWEFSNILNLEIGSRKLNDELEKYDQYGWDTYLLNSDALDKFIDWTNYQKICNYPHDFEEGELLHSLAIKNMNDNTA